MCIPRLIVSLLISVWVATIAAQSSLDKSAVPQSLPTAIHNEQAGIHGDQNPPAPLGKLVDVGGYRVHLYCIGTGSPVVVIVGAGFSFDWGLVQPEVAKSIQVCAYDHSGIGWSDSGPKDSCSLRVGEVHNALKNAGIKWPYVLVGHSLGAVVARLYAGRFPDEVAGIVFAEHAFSLFPPSDAKIPPPQPPSKSPNLSWGGIERDPNFSRLSSRDRELHLWAMSQSRNQMALQTNVEIMPQCIAEADAVTKDHSHTLGNKPLVVISVNTDTRVPEYADIGFPRAKFLGPSPYNKLQTEYDKLQTELLSLSLNSKHVIAENSGHFVIIDRPDVVIDAIKQVVKSARDKAPL
jgi:pimeloyl-ACP methyl ester carboxylesterase